MIVPAGIAEKKYIVLGLGKTGDATVAALLAANAQVLAWDDTPDTRAKAKANNIPLADPARLDWNTITALVMSPGIPHTYPAPHPFAAAAKAAGVPILGDIALLFQALPQARYVGITGTNGKSTTTSLIGHILHSAGVRAEVGGNLGTPVLSFAPLDQTGVYVLELSSYQLELMPHNLLQVGIMLNITPDHLDRHGGMDGYTAAKQRVIRCAGAQTLIIGLDDEPSRHLAAQAATMPNITLRGISQATQKQAAVYTDNAQLIDNIDGLAQRVLDLKTLHNLVGGHNWQNIAAAYAATKALGLSTEAIIAGIKSFPGLAHRQQLITTRHGIKYVNDSKATNADATSKALACYDKIYWIIGGRPKEGGLNGLEPFMPRIRHAFLIGEASDNFSAWLDGKASYTRCGTLDKAVAAAAAMAEAEGQANAVVLLSPACASWDQFKNFEQRGEVFADLVHNLPTTTMPTARGTA
jgi:UDP-N-acetylmuramoylalanine--D-glutamate ligase